MKLELNESEKVLLKFILSAADDNPSWDSEERKTLDNIIKKVN